MINQGAFDPCQSFNDPSSKRGFVKNSTFQRPDHFDESMDQVKRILDLEN